MGILYQKRRLKVNKVKRRLAARRAFLQRFRVFLSTLMIAGICWFGIKVLKLPMWYIDQNKLNAADPSVLKIEGNKITPDYKIINMIRQTSLPCTQVFRLDTTELEQNISRLQPVKKVYIRRYWFPARLHVIIDERTPAFLLAPNLETLPNNALTTDGILIDHDFLPLIDKDKTKKLLTYGVKDGVDEVWDKKKVDEILSLVKAIETYSNQNVQYVDMRNQKDIYIMLEKYLIRFGQIDDTAPSRAKWIASILPEAEKFGSKVKYIDLRWEEAHYLRLQGAKETANTGAKKTEKPNKPVIKNAINLKEEDENIKTQQEEIENMD